MSKLKLGAIPDNKPVKLTIQLSSEVHGDLLAYAALLGHETGQKIEANRLVAPMLEKFMASDRAFVKGRKAKGEDQAPTD